jgi:cation-transporting ATPase 13A3/4/5
VCHLSQVIQTRFYGNEKVRAVVLRTGFLTAKGNLIRSIMYPPPADFKFDQDSYKFIGILAAIAGVGFLYALALKVTVEEAVRGQPLPTQIYRRFRPNRKSHPRFPVHSMVDV